MLLKEIKNLFSVGSLIDTEQIGMVSILDEPEVLWLSGSVEHRPRFGKRGMAICGSRDDANGTSQIRHVVDRPQIRSRKAQSRRKLKQQ